MTSEEKVQKLEDEAGTAEEDLKTAICDTCVWPFRETDQEKMTERCDNCPIMEMLSATLQQARGAGYARAILDAMESVVAAHENVFGGAGK